MALLTHFVIVLQRADKTGRLLRLVKGPSLWVVSACHPARIVAVTRAVKMTQEVSFIIYNIRKHIALITNCARYITNCSIHLFHIYFPSYLLWLYMCLTVVFLLHCYILTKWTVINQIPMLFGSRSLGIIFIFSTLSI